MIADQVLELDRQRAQQAQAAEQAEQQAQDEKNQQAFCKLVWQLHDGEDIAPEKVLELLDQCDRNAVELQCYLESLEERQANIDWLAENVETETIQSIGQRLEDARVAFEEAQKHYQELYRNFDHDRKSLANRQSHRASLQRRIEEIESTIPRPTKAKD